MAHLLRTLRQNKGLTQKEVASILGYSEQLVSVWEKGSSFPDASVWDGLCKLYDISLSSLLLEDLTVTGMKVKEPFDINAFASRLLMLRRMEKWTQEQVASSLEVNVKTVISFEKGKSLPSKKIFLALCDLYKTKPEELYYGVEVPSVVESGITDNVAIQRANKPRFPRVLLIASLGVVALTGIVFGASFLPSVMNRSSSNVDSISEHSISEVSISVNSTEISTSSMNSSSSAKSLDGFVLADYKFPTDVGSIRKYAPADQINAHIYVEDYERFIVPVNYGETPFFDFYEENLLDVDGTNAYIFQKYEGDYSPCFKDRNFYAKYKTIPLEKYESSPYEFCFTEDGEGLRLYRYKGVTSETFEIPSMIAGYPVRVLDFLLFEDDTIKNLIIPDTVTRIRSPIIAGSNKLKTIRLSENLERVDNYIVPSCPNLTYLNDDNNQYLGSLTNPYLYCANSSPSDGVIRFRPQCRIINSIADYLPVERIVLPQSLGYLSQTALPELQHAPSLSVEEGCEHFQMKDGCLIDVRDQSIVSLEQGVSSLPSGIRRIKTNALYNYEGESLELPSSLTHIEGTLSSKTLAFNRVDVGPELTSIQCEAFSNCTSIEEFVIHPDNAAFESYEGAFYSKNKERLLFYPGHKDINEYIATEETLALGRLSFNKAKNIKHVQVFPKQNEVPTCLGPYSFVSCPELTNVEINVNSICSSAFYDCPKLERVVLGKGIMSIESCAFDACLGLKSIYYGGSEEEWKEVQVDKDAFFPNFPNLIFLG